VAAKETYMAILNVLRTLQDNNLLYFYQSPIIIQNNEFEMVTWPNHNIGAGHNKASAFATLSQYQCILHDNSYLAVLRDGAIIKGNYVFRSNDLIRYSLWYWPCPFEISHEDIESETPLGALDLYSLSWEEAVRFRTPLRFDYDTLNENPGHPMAHLHIQVPECRIPVARPLGFATFVRFIFRNFFSDDWQSNDLWNDLIDEFENKIPPCLAPGDLYHPHIGWSRLL